MKRRQFFKSALAGTALTQFPRSLFGRSPNTYKPYPSKTLRAPKKNTKSLNLQVLDGNIPADIHGHGFVLEGMTDRDNTYVKSGKGAINRLDFSPEGVSWSRSLIKTPSVRAAEELEGSKHGFKPLGKMVYSSQTLGYMNTSNTSAMTIQDGRMILTFEGGAHWEFDPKSLELITPIGKPSEWKSSITGIMGAFGGGKLFDQVRTTAHPYFDKNTDELWTLNYATKLNIFGIPLGQPFTRLLRFNGKDKLDAFDVVDATSGRNVALTNTSHSFLVTENHIGIVDTPAVVEGEIFVGMNKTRAQPAHTIVWWVKRQDLIDLESGQKVKAHRLVLDREYIDLLVNFKEDNDEITIYSGSIQSYDQSEFLKERLKERDTLHLDGKPCRGDLLGLNSGPNDCGGFMRTKVKVTELGAEILDDTSAVMDPKLTWGIDFPAYLGNYKNPDHFDYMYWNTVGFHPDQVLSHLVELYKNQPFRNVPVDKLPTEAIPPAVIGVDCNTMEIADYYMLPEGCALTSLQFIPKKGNISEMKQGYLFCFVHRDDGYDSQKSSGQEIWIFDGENLSAGPVCKLGHTQLNVATTLHSTWTPQMLERLSLYKVDLYSEYEAKIRKLPSELQELCGRIFTNESELS